MVTVQAKWEAGHHLTRITEIQLSRFQSVLGHQFPLWPATYKRINSLEYGPEPPPELRDAWSCRWRTMPAFKTHTSLSVTVSIRRMCLEMTPTMTVPWRRTDDVRHDKSLGRNGSGCGVLSEVVQCARCDGVQCSVVCVLSRYSKYALVFTISVLCVQRGFEWGRLFASVCSFLTGLASTKVHTSLLTQRGSSSHLFSLNLVVFTLSFTRENPPIFWHTVFNSAYHHLN